MIRNTFRLRFLLSPALLLILLGSLACGSDAAQEETSQRMEALTQGLDSLQRNLDALGGELDALKGALATAQEGLVTTQEALGARLAQGEASLTEGLAAAKTELATAQEQLASLTTGESALQGSLAGAQEGLASAQEGLAKAQEGLAALELGLSDLKDSFLLTREEVARNSTGVASNADKLEVLAREVAELRGTQEEAAQAITRLEEEIGRVSATNEALEARVTEATGYAAVTNAYFDYVGAVTQAARNTAILALRDAVARTEDPDLGAALDDWLNSSPVEQEQLLAVFVDILGTKLVLSLTS